MPMIKRDRVRFAPPAILVTFLVGCAATAPQELLDARDAYSEAAQSRAPQYAPAQLQTARDALGKAEDTFDDQGDSEKTRDLSYVAQRRAQIAMVQGNIKESEKQKELAQSELLNTATSTAESKSNELRNVNDQLEKERVEKAAVAARAREAEAKLKEAMDRLTAIAAIKEEPRGLVITLPGGVLFESGRATLLASAQERLNQVADALLQNRDANIVVEGHTDSQGDDASNQKLSEDRAKSVRDYLVSRGIANDRIRSVGHGEKTPVADNNSAEGRANNRRVEIVVERNASSK